jgi:cold shock protein
MAVFRSVVKWFDAKKGYGFIVHPDGEADVFVHYSTIDTDKRFRTLRTGQVVEFELKEGPKGLHAHNVKSLEADPDGVDAAPHPDVAGHAPRTMA